MPRRKPPTPDQVRELRQQLHEAIEHGGLSVAETVCRMREALGMTQARFGAVFKLTERQVWELENGKANPTAETLDRLGKPFGFRVGFILRAKDSILT
jgi:transcriptional regulator with XRE-family HTH domain